eukprot:gene8410-235_t
MNKENIDPRTGKEIQTIRRGPHRAPLTDITMKTPIKPLKPQERKETITSNEGDRNLIRKLKLNKRSPVKYFR